MLLEKLKDLKGKSVKEVTLLWQAELLFCHFNYVPLTGHIYIKLVKNDISREIFQSTWEVYKLQPVAPFCYISVFSLVSCKKVFILRCKFPTIDHFRCGRVYVWFCIVGCLLLGRQRGAAVCEWRVVTFMLSLQVIVSGRWCCWSHWKIFLPFASFKMSAAQIHLGCDVFWSQELTKTRLSNPWELL